MKVQSKCDIGLRGIFCFYNMAESLLSHFRKFHDIFVFLDKC